MKPKIRVMASLLEADLSVFVVAELAGPERPANGGLRLLPYGSDTEAVTDGRALAHRMSEKHRLYRTGFRGGKVVARATDPVESKTRVLTVTRALLDALEGRMLTGCDLNVSNRDMELLSQRSPYVLAAVGHPTDASTATARGVLGAFEAARRMLPGGPVQRVVVHGVGAVGRRVAEDLVEQGFEVLTVDRDPERSVDGARTLAEPWWTTAADAHLLCSASRLVTESIARELTTRMVVSGANAPFANDEAEARLAGRGALILPDPLANAGAVIADSIEYYAPSLWRRAQPEEVYRFVERAVAERTGAFLELRRSRSRKDALVALMHDEESEPIGVSFRPQVELRVAG